MGCCEELIRPKGKVKWKKFEDKPVPEIQDVEPQVQPTKPHTEGEKKKFVDKLRDWFSPGIPVPQF